ncbi:helix-turn-helix domain-containing protein [Microbacterium keratanolyticum]
MNATSARSRPAAWWAAAVALGGTTLIGIGAFWLSFTALTDLARLAGIAADQAWVWALIIDGVIVVCTVSVAALDDAGWRAVAYPWSLLAAAAAVSVVANIVHAIMQAPAAMPRPLAGAIAAVPPLVLLAGTHLTVVVGRHSRHEPAAPIAEPLGTAPAPTPSRSKTTVEPRRAMNKNAGTPTRGRRHDTETTRRLAGEAIVLHGQGSSSREIAEQLGVHRSTVDRWLNRAPSGASEETTRNENRTESEK